jgi:hypothetical protein
LKGVFRLNHSGRDSGFLSDEGIGGDAKMRSRFGVFHDFVIFDTLRFFVFLGGHSSQLLTVVLGSFGGALFEKKNLFPNVHRIQCDFLTASFSNF